MSKTVRTIIFYLFVLFFLVTAPALVLYTAGFGVNLHNGRIERFGALVIKSKPRGATTILNAMKITEETPATIKIAPDDYAVTVQKTGYSTWSKRLTVKSQETTFAEDIVLWKENASQKIIDAPSTVAAFSSDMRFLVWLEERGGSSVFHVFDLARGIETGITSVRTHAENALIQFSKDNTMALIANYGLDGYARVIPLLNPAKTIDLGTVTHFPFRTYSWSATNTTLYGVVKGTLHAVNLLTGHDDAIAPAETNFRIINTDIWSVKNRAGIPELIRSSPQLLADETKSILELPSGTDGFLDIDRPLLALYATGHSTITILEPSAIPKPLLETTGDALVTRTNRNNQTEILSWTSFELWRSNLETGATELLRRQSAHIKKAAWYPGEYVLFSTATGIYALELDDRDARNVTQLVDITTGTIADFGISKNGAVLYYAVAGGPMPGLYVQDLQ